MYLETRESKLQFEVDSTNLIYTMVDTWGAQGYKVPHPPYIVEIYLLQIASL